jgi:O-acetyl-ADP-ribose deacetylase (regulator of RNase III)
MHVEVRLDDLAFFDGEAIAWPVDAELRPITPVTRRLEAAGGTTLAQLLRTQEPLPVGSAVVTAAGALPVGLLVSAVVASETEPVTRSGVRRAMTSAMQRAADWQIGHLGVAPFGLGAGNLDAEESAEIMFEVIGRHRAPYPARVTIVVETQLEEAAFGARVAEREQ